MIADQTKTVLTLLSKGYTYTGTLLHLIAGICALKDKKFAWLLGLHKS